MGISEEICPRVCVPHPGRQPLERKAMRAVHAIIAMLAVLATLLTVVSLSNTADWATVGAVIWDRKYELTLYIAGINSFFPLKRSG